jgi:DNA-binding MarR family transcriptional regulator
VDRLLAKGYVARETAKQDRRQILVGLTALGRRAQGEYLAMRHAFCAEILGALEDEEGERMVAALERMRSALGD